MIGRKKSRAVVVEDEKPKGFDDFELRLGDMMRGERATLGKSLLDVQRELKIKAAYISAIEDCNPDVFETPGFIAGYVRSYARYLGLNPETTFDAFCAESGFSTAHGMSAEASSIKKSRAAEIIASAPATRDPIAQPSTPFAPSGEAFLSRVEPGAIGSTLVLACLLGAIGFGGWTVLNEVQRVRIAPVEDTPVVLTDLDPIDNATRQVAQTDDTIPTTLSAGSDAPLDGLDRLYRPKALDAPVLVARDAPISTLDPSRLGAFATADAGPNGTTAAPNLENGSQVFDTDSAVAAAIPQVVEQTPDQVKLVAVRPAWVRVKAADGSTVFAGILNAGDTYTIPMTEDPSTLRVGESGAIYFSMNGQHYGPAGPRGQVTSGVVLAAQSLNEAYKVADITQDRDLERFVAQLTAQPAVGTSE